MLEAPLVVSERGGVAVHVSVGARDEGGRRAVVVRSRPQDVDGEAGEWLVHARAVLSETGTDAGAHVEIGTQGVWPPVGVGRVDVDGL
ncbi:hypothetical protein B7755_051920, partial [Streptomyces sp. NBS 14/10]|uniref:hypothetical protein n=1 Tax=Streptomyces sp. NBS 14/10 TaxID=1945643 RepID=UPI00272F2B9C